MWLFVNFFLLQNDHGLHYGSCSVAFFHVTHLSFGQKLPHTCFKFLGEIKLQINFFLAFVFLFLRVIQSERFPENKPRMQTSITLSSIVKLSCLTDSLCLMHTALFQCIQMGKKSQGCHGDECYGCSIHRRLPQPEFTQMGDTMLMDTFGQQSKLLFSQ